MESIKINQENLNKIKNRIELNSFAEKNLGEMTVGMIKPKDLLTTEEIEDAKVKHEKRDSFYERFSINTLLKFCLKENNFNLSEGVVEIESEMELGLPEGYGFKGGAARTALRKVLGLRNNEPRDYDLIRTSENETYEGADDELARKYMEKDFEFGDGVEFLNNTDEYFKTRDFSINEVYVVDNKVFATEDCIRDTLRGIVRVTDYELGNYRDDFVGLGPKMKSKALRFHVEQLYTTGISNLHEEDLAEIEDSFINPFWLSVQLDRAFERSQFLADKFTELLLALKIIPSTIVDSLDLVEYLKNEIEGDFYFRSVPERTRDLENEFSGIEEFDEGDYWERYFDSLK